MEYRFRNVGSWLSIPQKPIGVEFRRDVAMRERRILAMMKRVQRATNVVSRLIAHDILGCISMTVVMLRVEKDLSGWRELYANIIWRRGFDTERLP
jgi:hypothetical protein